MCFMTMVQYKVKIISFMVMHSDGSNEFLGSNDSGFGFAIFGQGGDSYQKVRGLSAGLYNGNYIAKII